MLSTCTVQCAIKEHGWAWLRGSWSRPSHQSQQRRLSSSEHCNRMSCACDKLRSSALNDKRVSVLPFLPILGVICLSLSLLPTSCVSSAPQGRNHQPARTSLQTAATSNKPPTSEAARFAVHTKSAMSGLLNSLIHINWLLPLKP